MLVIGMRQSSSPPAKAIYIHCGGRPSVVEGFTYSVGSWVKSDGRNDDTYTVSTLPGGTVAAGTAPDVCKLMPYGFALGVSTTWVGVANAGILLRAQVEGADNGIWTRDVDMSSASLGEGDAIWLDPKNAFDYIEDDDFEDVLPWIRVEA